MPHERGSSNCSVVALNCVKYVRDGQTKPFESLSLDLDFVCFHEAAAGIETYNVERVLTDIDRAAIVQFAPISRKARHKMHWAAMRLLNASISPSSISRFRWRVTLSSHEEAAWRATTAS